MDRLLLCGMNWCFRNVVYLGFKVRYATSTSMEISNIFFAGRLTVFLLYHCWGLVMDLILPMVREPNLCWFPVCHLNKPRLTLVFLFLYIFILYVLNFFTLMLYSYWSFVASYYHPRRQLIQISQTTLECAKRRRVNWWF